VGVLVVQDVAVVIRYLGLYIPFSKGGLISMANGGMITVGDKTYSPEDFGFASKVLL
jgi:hypothetical protein